MITSFLEKKDYRSEEIDVLRKSGLSQEKIDAYVPPSTTERIAERKKTISEYEQLKQDVATLKEEMKMMKEKVGLVEDDKADKVEKKDSKNTSLEEKQ